MDGFQVNFPSGTSKYPKKYLLTLSLCTVTHPPPCCWCTQCAENQLKNLTKEEAEHLYVASILPNSPAILKWILLTSLEGGGETLSHSENIRNEVKKDQRWSDTLADAIHHLANLLPFKGFLLDVLWLVDNSEVNLDGNITLFGALMRLKSWHNAKIFLVPVVNNIPENNMTMWKSSLEVTVLSSSKSCEEFLSKNLLWRGNLVLKEGKSDASVSLPGFELSKGSDSSIAVKLKRKCQRSGDGHENGDVSTKFFCMENCMEVVDMVRLHDIPRCLLLPDKYMISTPSQYLYSQSADFLHWLTHPNSENETIALIAEIPCVVIASSDDDICKNVGLGTEQWINQVADNSDNLSVPLAVSKIPENHDSVYFLIYGDHQGNCCAQPFVPQGELNGQFHDTAAHMEVLGYSAKKDSGEKFSEAKADILDGLPLLAKSALKEMLDDVADLQLDVLKKFIEERKDANGHVSVPLDELHEMFRTVSSDFLASFDWKDKVEKFMVGRDLCALDVACIPTDLDQNPDMWLERLALYNKEAVEEKLRRTKSSDTTLGGIAVPPPTNDTITLHVDASEFLKHFTSAGLPIGQDFSPIGISRRSRTSATPSKSKKFLNELTDDAVARMSFKEALKIDYPGVNYYFHTKKFHSLDVDKKLMRLQQRLVRAETSSTCSQDSEKAVIKLRRRSPSKTPSKETPKKKQDGVGSLPKTHVVRKSPRTLKRPRGSEREGSPRKRARISSSVSKVTQSPSKRLVASKSQSKRTLKKVTPRKMTPRKLSSRLISVPDKKVDLVPSNQNSGSKSHDEQEVQRSARRSLYREDVALRKSPKKKSRQSETEISQKKRKLSRSELHKKKLQQTVDEVLKQKGIDADHVCFSRCSSRLYNLTKSFVKDLKTSHGLFEEMRKIAESNADLVVQFELKNTPAQ